MNAERQKEGRITTVPLGNCSKLRPLAVNKPKVSGRKVPKAD